MSPFSSLDVYGLSVFASGLMTSQRLRDLSVDGPSFVRFCEASLRVLSVGRTSVNCFPILSCRQDSFFVRSSPPS